jgi:hypothetical protein
VNDSEPGGLGEEGDDFGVEPGIARLGDGSSDAASIMLLWAWDSICRVTPPHRTLSSEIFMYSTRLFGDIFIREIIIRALVMQRSEWVCHYMNECDIYTKDQ